MKPKTLSWLLAVLLFAVVLVMYANALPASFNTRYENIDFFDSDGEFITRQFRESSIYAHNPHLTLKGVTRWNTDNVIVLPIPKRWENWARNKGK